MGDRPSASGVVGTTGVDRHRAGLASTSRSPGRAAATARSVLDRQPKDRAGAAGRDVLQVGEVELVEVPARAKAGLGDDLEQTADSVDLRRSAADVKDLGGATLGEADRPDQWQFPPPLETSLVDDR